MTRAAVRRWPRQPDLLRGRAGDCTRSYDPNNSRVVDKSGMTLWQGMTESRAAPT